MNIEMQIFNNPEFGAIRTVVIDGEPWFVGKDVASALGYANTADAIQKHVDNDDKLESQIAISGQNRKIIVINESGLYFLVLSSKLPSAKKFKHWVTSKVLPSIRKYGAYMTEDTLEKALTSPDFLIQLATKLKEEQEKNKALKADNDRMKPKERFADAVATSHTSILIGDLAKLVKQNGVDIGQKRMFAWMRDNGYLIKRNGSDWNMPTQKSMELGLFEVKESTINNPDGTVRITRTTKVTGKGQQYFINKFLSQSQEG